MSAVKRNHSLFYALETLVKDENFTRVPVVDHQRNLLCIITQSTVLEWIIKNLESVGSKKDKPLSEIPSLFRPVPHIYHYEQALRAFVLMREHVRALFVPHFQCLTPLFFLLLLLENKWNRCTQ
jgi:hypothetical protein